MKGIMENKRLLLSLVIASCVLYLASQAIIIMILGIQLAFYLIKAGRDKDIRQETNESR